LQPIDQIQFSPQPADFRDHRGEGGICPDIPIAASTSKSTASSADRPRSAAITPLNCRAWEDDEFEEEENESESGEEVEDEIEADSEKANNPTQRTH
jgi:hypothetical protein